jgi:hypothetical protein
MMSDSLVIVAAMQIIVPLIAVPMLDVIPALAAVLDLAACIIGLKNVSTVFFTMTLAVL